MIGDSPMESRVEANSSGSAALGRSCKTPFASSTAATATSSSLQVGRQDCGDAQHAGHHSSADAAAKLPAQHNLHRSGIFHDFCSADAKERASQHLHALTIAPLQELCLLGVSGDVAWA